MRLFIVLFFIGITRLLTAQDKETPIYWNSETEWNDEFSSRKFITTIKKQTYCVTTKVTSTSKGKVEVPYLEVYNEKGDFVKRSKILTDTKKDFVMMFEFWKTIYLVRSLYDSDKGKRSLYMQAVSTEFMRTDGREKRIGTVSCESKDDKVRLLISKSPDISKIALCVSPTKPKNKRRTQFRVYMFKIEKERLRRGYSKPGKLDYPFPSLITEDIAINDEGDIFVLLNSGGARKKDPELKTDIELAAVSFTHNGDSIKAHLPDVASKNIIESFITPSSIEAETGFAITAFYREEDKDILNGAFSYVYGRSGNLVEKNSILYDDYRLPLDITRAPAEEAMDKKWKALSRKLNNRRRGNYLMSELFYRPMKGKEELSNDFKYYDLLVAYTNEKGLLEWVQVIPKRQITSDDNGNYSSYHASLARGGRLALLFNDVSDNFDEKESAATEDYEGINSADAEGNAVVKVVVSKDGYWRKKHLLLDGTVEGALMPSACASDKFGESLLFVRDIGFKTFRVAKIDLSFGYK